jgi:hypothetical protein
MKAFFFWCSKITSWDMCGTLSQKYREKTKEFYRQDVDKDVTFGLLASLSAVQATEVDDVIQSRLGEDVSAQAGYYDDWWTSKGPQGPIRSDLIEANSSETD